MGLCQNQHLHSQHNVFYPIWSERLRQTRRHRIKRLPAYPRWFVPWAFFVPDGLPSVRGLHTHAKRILRGIFSTWTAVNLIRSDSNQGPSAVISSRLTVTPPGRQAPTHPQHLYVATFDPMYIHYPWNAVMSTYCRAFS